MSFGPLTIGRHTAQIPIIQGGMGVGISLSGLASAVSREGAVGVISAVEIGMDEPDYRKNKRDANIRALRKEIRRARELSGNGVIGVNIMVAINNYEEMVQAAVNESVDLIIAGAGLPLTLPQYVIDSSTAVIPIVSSAKAFQLIARKWERNYSYCPDAVIVEGPLAGGHLGFSLEQLESLEKNRLEDIVVEVIKEAQVFEDKYGQRIPVIAAGGIWDGHDIARFLELGCAGVQMGTRFVATFECDASENFKKAYLEAGVDDVLIIKSPVGMPGRAVRSPFITQIKDNPVKVKCQYNCLRPCNPKEAPYCIAEALINAKKGNFDKGFAFCGANVHRVDRLQSVHSLLQELIDETRSIIPRTVR
ncbi:MAG: NAD(P)H-dependent flavin oxidoreductase [Syntrophomonadales bacterium]|jgi:nitronate monooxygenase